MTIESYETIQAIENRAERDVRESARNTAMREMPRKHIATLVDADARIARGEAVVIHVNGQRIAAWREFAGGSQACPVERLGLMVRTPVEKTQRIIDPTGKTPTRDVTGFVPSDAETFIGWANVREVEVKVEDNG